MDLETFEKMLKEAGLTKRELAKILNKSPQTVYNWGKAQDIPYWVESWLKNYIELKKCKSELNHISLDKEILRALSIKIFNRLYNKNLLSEIVYDSDLERYIYFEFIHPYKDKIINDVPLEAKAEKETKEILEKYPELNEDVKQKLFRPIKNELLKRYREAEEKKAKYLELKKIVEEMEKIKKDIENIKKQDSK